MDFSHFGLFYTLTWILSFSALRKSWATGSDFQTASLSKFSKKVKIWCGFTLFLYFFSSKQAFYRLPALTQSQATGFNLTLWKTRAEIERTTTIWDGFFAFWSFQMDFTYGVIRPNLGTLGPSRRRFRTPSPLAALLNASRKLYLALLPVCNIVSSSIFLNLLWHCERSTCMIMRCDPGKRPKCEKSISNCSCPFDFSAGLP